MDISIVPIEKGPGIECVIGQGNFSIFTVDTLATTLKAAVPSLAFGVAMNEAKPRLVRVEGNDDDLCSSAAEACRAIGAGHVFVVMMKGAFPINVLNAVKGHPAVCRVYAASENPLEALVGETELGRSVIGVVDGTSVNAVEDNAQRKERKEILQMLGY
ncbi:MAG TPA: adenosine monophosphate-protein transferase [Methanomicrobia archaeon]|nr:adenosine monophosphate-protein transferase [Methanomicrobia archaeon]